MLYKYDPSMGTKTVFDEFGTGTKPLDETSEKPRREVSKGASIETIYHELIDSKTDDYIKWDDNGNPYVNACMMPIVDLSFMNSLPRLLEDATRVVRHHLLTEIFKYYDDENLLGDMIPSRILQYVYYGAYSISDSFNAFGLPKHCPRPLKIIEYDEYNEYEEEVIDTYPLYYTHFCDNTAYPIDNSILFENENHHMVGLNICYVLGLQFLAYFIPLMVLQNDTQDPDDIIVAIYRTFFEEDYYYEINENTGEITIKDHILKQ